ncbi:MAG: SDR family oxidoreductase [Chloroflexi bacterium]|nr:SDR family oxidoreductase [Chloroflexota bacterium]
MAKKNQVVLITGATRGIGRATALHLAGKGHRVVATGRNAELLESLEREAQDASLPLSVEAMDVTDDGAVQRVVAKTVEESDRIDALVNNAGYGLWGALEDLTMSELREQFETNVFAVWRLSQAVLPIMRRNGFGTIVNVGSVSGRIGNPAGGAYAASKAALSAMSRVMRMEVAAFGVRVVLIEPGLFRTDFQENQVNAKRVSDPESPYAEAIGKARKRRTGPFAGADPHKVAVRIGQVIEGKRPKARYSVGLDALAGTIATRLLPDGALDAAVRRAVGW